MGLNIAASPTKLREIAKYKDQMTIQQLSRYVRIVPEVVQRLVDQMNTGKLKIQVRGGMMDPVKGKPNLGGHRGITAANQNLEQENAELRLQLADMQKVMRKMDAFMSAQPSAAALADAEPTKGEIPVDVKTSVPPTKKGA